MIEIIEPHSEEQQSIPYIKRNRLYSAIDGLIRKGF